MYIVTGASSGIGYAIVCELLQRGMCVVSVARRTIANEKIHQYGSRAISISADVTTDEGLRSIALAVANSPIKGIVHAAGSTIPLTPYESLSVDDLIRDMAVHVLAPVAINNLLQEQLSGSRIIYIDSYSANAPRIGWSGYSIVKAAAQMAARTAKAELTDGHVIRVFPGGVRTPLVEGVLRSTIDSPTSIAFKKLNVEGKILEPEVVGLYIADVLLNATEQQLESREYWDFNNPEDRVF